MYILVIFNRSLQSPFHCRRWPGHQLIWNEDENPNESHAGRPIPRGLLALSKIWTLGIVPGHQLIWKSQSLLPKSRWHVLQGGAFDDLPLHNHWHVATSEGESSNANLCRRQADSTRKRIAVIDFRARHGHYTHGLYLRDRQHKTCRW